MTILANVDKSILSIELGKGLKICSMSENKFLTFISQLDFLPLMAAAHKINLLRCFNYKEKKYYFITKSFFIDYSDVLSGTSQFDRDIYHEYLVKLIRIIRLLNGGDIRIAATYYYTFKDGEPKSLIKSWAMKPISDIPFKLSKKRWVSIKNHMKNLKLPFRQSYLNLAFENFELAYYIDNKDLSFLTLMIALEILFNPGGSELRYRISRNVGVLLGKSKKDSNEIFKDIKMLYDKRSKIVHSGKKNTINKEDLSKLRDYVRKSILSIIYLKKGKDELLSYLNSLGFGQRIKKCV